MERSEIREQDTGPRDVSDYAALHPRYNPDMVLYRRNFVPGGTFFFTATLADRQSCALVEHIDLLKYAFRMTRHERPFLVDAVVVLPDHVHVVMTLPPDDADFPGRWKRCKSLFTRLLARRDGVGPPNRRGEYTLWQRRYWEHTIRDEADLTRHIDYIHFNPVRHKLVPQVSAWRYSSFHRYVRLGVLPRDWGGKADDDSRFGERRG